MQQLAGIINESSDLTADQIALNYSNTSPNTPSGATPGATPLKEKIREMILAELGNSDKKVNEYDSETPAYDNSSPYGSEYEMSRYRGEMANIGIETDSEGKPTTNNSNNELEEAKKDEEEVEDVEVEDTETEEAPAEETPATSGGLEDIAADMEGTEGDLMDHLMKALKVAKGMNNEKLETQIGNTLKFFVSEYIGGEEQ